MVTLFWIVSVVGVVSAVFGAYVIVKSNKIWDLYMRTSCSCKSREHLYRKYHRYNDMAPFAFIGVGLALAGLISAAHFHCMNGELAIKAKETIMTKYDNLVIAEEKEAWLATEVGAASSNEIAKLCEMMPKMSAEKKAKLADTIIKLKMKGGDKSVLAFSFMNGDAKDILCNAMSYELNGNVIVFHCIFEEEGEVEEEVDVPGELVHGGIRYAQVNGKHVLFHKEKRKAKKTVDTVKKVECKIL